MGMRQLAVVVFATGSLVLTTTAGVLPQIGPDYEGIPAPLEKAVDATNLIAQARLISFVNEAYSVTVIGPNGPQLSSVPTTVFTVEVVKCLKRAPGIRYEGAKLRFRKAGFTAHEGSPPNVKRGADPAFPVLPVGHQYVFLLTSN